MGHGRGMSAMTAELSESQCQLDLTAVERTGPEPVARLSAAVMVVETIPICKGMFGRQSMVKFFFARIINSHIAITVYLYAECCSAYAFMTQPTVFCAQRKPVWLIGHGV